MPAAGAKAQTTPVTVDNFTRAESDMYFAVAVKQAGGIGKFFHHREVMSVEHQTVVRANRDMGEMFARYQMNERKRNSLVHIITSLERIHA